MAMTAWYGAEADWDEQLAKLVAYKEENGHSNVPLKYPADKALGAWVQSQRNYYARLMVDGRDPSALITKARIAKINVIGARGRLPMPCSALWPGTAHSAAHSVVFR